MGMKLSLIKLLNICLEIPLIKFTQILILCNQFKRISFVGKWNWKIFKMRQTIVKTKNNFGVESYKYQKWLTLTVVLTNNVQCINSPTPVLIDLLVYFGQKRSTQRHFELESVLSAINWWNFMYSTDYNRMKFRPLSLLDVSMQIKINVTAHIAPVYANISRSVL